MRRISGSLILFWAALLLAVFAPTASGSSGKDARVVGKVLLCGRPRRGPVRCFPANHAVVSVYNPRHRLVARKRVADARFRFRLRPGRYELCAHRPGDNSGTRTVLAKAHRTVHTQLRFALH